MILHLTASSLSSVIKVYTFISLLSGSKSRTDLENIGTETFWDVGWIEKGSFRRWFWEVETL
jgi:hypothetical protein